MLIRPQQSPANELADRIAAEIRHMGMSFEEFEDMLERSRDARLALQKDLYGVDLVTR